MIKLTHVEGKNKGQVVLYALSTCGWCHKAKKLLSDLGVAYDYVDVDLLDENNTKEAEQIVKKWNPDESYPTIVINDKISITAYNMDKIKEALGV